METNRNKQNRGSRSSQDRWVKDAAYRLQRRKMLRYSSNIARRILAAIEDNKELNQKLLADKLEVSPQYISKLLKGNENLSLETIAKISDVLNVELITFPSYKYSQPAKASHEYTKEVAIGQKVQEATEIQESKETKKAKEPYMYAIRGGNKPTFSNEPFNAAMQG